MPYYLLVAITIPTLYTIHASKQDLCILEQILLCYKHQNSISCHGYQDTSLCLHQCRKHFSHYHCLKKTSGATPNECVSKTLCAYKSNEIDNIARIHSEQKLAIDLNGLSGNVILLNTLQSGILHFIIEKRVCKSNDSKQRQHE